MRTHTLVRKQYLPISLEQAWEFFSSPRNLEEVTPDDMGFEITTPFDDKPMFEGQRISYIVRPLFGIPLKWESLIERVNKPHSFTDRQLKGPYKLWIHTHSFEEESGGVMVCDEVKYALPLGFIGELAHNFFVKRKLEQIFDFRVQTLKVIFGK